MNNFVVAIDGPSGVGKSSLTKALAEKFALGRLDTGAMYRAISLLAMQNNMEPVVVAQTIDLQLGEKITANGIDVTQAIRTNEVAEAASRDSADPLLRRQLVALQQKILSQGDWVLEGRDTCTVVAPNAQVKIFLTASMMVRAQRRAEQIGGNIQEILEAQATRDARDSNRQSDPLQVHPDATVVDTSEMTFDQVVAQVSALIEAARQL